MGRKKRGDSPDARSGGSGPSGLSNLGNTCFFNSVLQSLRVSGLRELHARPKDESQLSAALADAWTGMQSQDGSCFNPKRLLGLVHKECPNLRRGAQHDAHELLRRLLDLAKQEGPFAGWLACLTRCDACGLVSQATDPVLDRS